MMNLSVPKLPFVLLPKDAPALTRPELERARWCCEACRDDTDLRVVEGFGERVVLCRGCRIDDGFLHVCNQRRALRAAERRARTVTP